LLRSLSALLLLRRFALLSLSALLNATLIGATDSIKTLKRLRGMLLDRIRMRRLIEWSHLYLLVWLIRHLRLLVLEHGLLILLDSHLHLLAVARRNLSAADMALERISEGARVVYCLPHFGRVSLVPEKAVVELILLLRNKDRLRVDIVEVRRRNKVSRRVEGRRKSLLLEIRWLGCCGLQATVR
jgi:hypothetical protein